LPLPPPLLPLSVRVTGMVCCIPFAEKVMLLLVDDVRPVVFAVTVNCWLWPPNTVPEEGETLSQVAFATAENVDVDDGVKVKNPVF